MTSTPGLPHIWVDQDTQLAELCEHWQTADELAMDTEFIRTDTFFPRPALFQIGDGAACYLLDVLALTNLEPLKKLLSVGPLKVFHSCSEDLEMLNHWLGVLPQPMVDTQLAAGFALKDAGKGYQRLVEDLLGIHLEKGETRSDWLQRPLTPAQEKYAAQDVEYLLPLWQELKKRLQDQGWLDAVLEESQWQVSEVATQESGQSWLRLKQAWQLDARQLAILQALADWREETARTRDRPRNRVASDVLLQALASKEPSHPAAMTGLPEASPGWIKRYAQEVLPIIAEAGKIEEAAWPETRISPLSREYKQTRKQLRQALAEQAEKLDVPQELLARRKQQDAWLHELLKERKPELPAGYPAWKQGVLQEALNSLKVDES